VKLTNGKELAFQQDKLSADDIAFLKENGKKVPASPSSSGSVKDLPDVLPDPDGKEGDMTKPVQVYILMGQSNMLGFGNPDALKTVAQGGTYPYLVDGAGEWTVRKCLKDGMPAASTTVMWPPPKRCSRTSIPTIPVPRITKSPGSSGGKVTRLPMFVSNSQDSAEPKPCGILIREFKHLRLEGGGVDGAGMT
jgi:hypothetical protein